MSKLHKIACILFSLGFVGFLWKYSPNNTNILRQIIYLAGFLAFLAVYSRWYLVKINAYNFWVIVRTLLLFFSAFVVYIFLPNSVLAGLFLFLTFFLLSFFLYFVGVYSENLLINETLITAFGFFFGGFAFAQIFSPAKFFLPALGLFLISLGLVRSFVELIPHSSKTKLVTSMCLALFVSELFWAISFLHFHFSALAILLFNLFYFCLILSYYHFFNTLNAKKVYFHFILIMLCSSFVIVATPWNVLK